MDADTEDLSRSISRISRSCLDLFQSCSPQNPDDVTELEAAQRRFRSWTNNLKVFSQNTSLDEQLASDKYSQIRQMVMLLLKVLEENLSLALQVATSHRTEVPDEPVLRIPMFGIDGSLKRLQKLAAVLLQATQGSLVKRSMLFAERHHDIEEVCRTFSLVILSRFEGLRPTGTPISSDARVPVGLIPTKEQILTTQPDGLLLAMVKTAVARHFRILYERERSVTTKAGPAESAVGTGMQQVFKPVPSGKVSSELLVSQSKENSAGKTHATAMGGDEIQSEKQPTILSIDMDRFNAGIARTESGSGDARQKINRPISEAGIASFPREPKIPDGQKEGTCPICRRRFPADEIQGPNWILHAYKDMKPYVCIVKDCLSSIQFFDHRRQWIDHMHKVHTALWIRYLHNGFRWNCAVCQLVSNVDYVSQQEAEGAFIEHLEQSHPDREQSEREYLVGISTVPERRSSEHCPICGTVHQPRPATWSEQGWERPKGQPSFVAQDPKNLTLKDASASKTRRKVGFAMAHLIEPVDVEGSQGKLQAKPSTWHATPATDVEDCVAEHLKALALYFCSRLVDDADQDSNMQSGRTSDNGDFERQELSEIDSEDEPPRLPSAKCDEVDNFPISDEEKAEIKTCIATNLRDLCVNSSGFDWNFTWIDGKRIAEPNIPDEERGALSSQKPHAENEKSWSEIDPDSILELAACLFMIAGLCKGLVSGISKPSADRRLHDIRAFSKARQDILSNLDTGTSAQKSRFIISIKEAAEHAEQIQSQILTMWETFPNSDNDRGVIDGDLLKFEEKLIFNIGLADLNGFIETKPTTAQMSRTVSNDLYEDAIESVTSAMSSGIAQIRRVVQSHTDRLAKVHVAHTESPESFHLKLFDPPEAEEDLESLRATIPVLRESVGKLLSHREISYRLGKLGPLLFRRFEITQNFKDLDEAIATTKDALDLSDEGESDRERHYHNLGVMLFRRFTVTRNIEVLQEAIRMTEHALDISDEGDPNRQRIFHNLEEMSSYQYEHTGDLQALDEAIQYKEKAKRTAVHADTGRSIHGRRTKRALLIGSSYKDAHELTGVRHDVEIMLRVLKIHEFPVENESLVKRVCGPAATRENILSCWDQLGLETGKDDTVVVYYSGYGTMVDPHVASPEQESQIQFLVPYDFDPSLATWNGILDIEISNLMRKITTRTKNVTFISDCRYSARLGRAPDSSELQNARKVPTFDYSKIARHAKALRDSGKVSDDTWPNHDVVRISAAARGTLVPDISAADGFAGALTSSLAAVMSSPDIRLSWRTLMVAVAIRMEKAFWSLTMSEQPQFAGPTYRIPFSTDTNFSQVFVAHAKEHHMIIQGGRVHGISDGDTFKLIPIQGPKTGVETTTDVKREYEVKVDTVYGFSALVTEMNFPRTSLALALPCKRSRRWPISFPTGVNTDVWLEDSSYFRGCESDEDFLVKLERIGEQVVLRTKTIELGRRTLSEDLKLEDALVNLFPTAETFAQAQYMLSSRSGTGVETFRPFVEFEIGEVWNGQKLELLSGHTLKRSHDEMSLTTDQRIYIEFRLKIPEVKVYISVLSIDGAGVISLITRAWEHGFELSSTLPSRIVARATLPFQGMPIKWPASVPKRGQVAQALIFFMTNDPINLLRLETPTTRDHFTDITRPIGSIVPYHVTRIYYNLSVS